MSENEDFFDYDEEESVKFIRNYLPQELKEKFSDDDINYIVDLIYDFYESKGYLNDDADEDEDIEIDEDELLDYVVKNAKKDGIGKFEPDEIRFIVQGELEYCDSIDMFE
ncbi:MAG: hypothetical protein LBV32_02415 [Tannerellaceae bacterium]|jgi:DNA-directed RNA polymerase specialized sigma54-like protein|nr:hypothetical protein [Tannerellaceae bacterium]